MKQTLKRLFLIPLVLFTGILLLSSSALAAYPYLPYLDYTAHFNYKDGVGGSNANKYKLTFNAWNITGGNYVDGSYFGEGDDPITGAKITISNLYNSSYPDNLYFDNTAGSSGGPVSFTISHGSNTYLSAQLDNFIITSGSFGTQLNPLFDYSKANLTNINFTPNGSQYIQELQASYLAHGYLNLSMDFAFNSYGPHPHNQCPATYDALTKDSSGTIQGKMAVTPEPVSSILFVAGGATLALRRCWKRKREGFYLG